MVVKEQWDDIVHHEEEKKKGLSTKNLISSKSRQKMKEFTASRLSLEEILDSPWGWSKRDVYLRGKCVCVCVCVCECVYTSLVAQTVKNLLQYGDLDSVSGLGRSSGEGNGYSLQYFCLENSMDREFWWATVHRVTKSWAQLKQPSTHAMWYEYLFQQMDRSILDQLSRGVDIWTEI